MKLVSVIIPIYNAEKTLQKCLDSLINQTYTEIELVLVNNASTDNSEQICHNICSFHPNKVHYVYTDIKGVSNARNLGIDSSQGEYIVFVDADDYVRPNYVAELVKHVELYDADLAICGYYTEKNNSLKASDCQSKSGLISHHELYKNIFCNNIIGGFSVNKIFVKKHLKGIYYDTAFEVCEDLDFVLRYAEKTEKVVYFSEPLYIYVINPTGATQKIKNWFNENNEYKYEIVIKKIIERNKEYIEKVDMMRAVLFDRASHMKFDYVLLDAKSDKVIREINRICRENFLVYIKSRDYSAHKKLESLIMWLFAFLRPLRHKIRRG